MSSTTHPMFAVLIGIDAYTHAADLKGPSNDLELMGRLCDRLQISESNRKVLAGQAATAAKIEAAFDWLETALDDANATALIHFSGHGTLFQQAGLQESLALAASDFDPDAQGTPTEQGVLTLADLAARFAKPKVTGAAGAATGAQTPNSEQEITSAFIEALADTKLARITVVLDCCWNQAGISTTTSVDMPLLTYRMLVGCSRGDVANEINMDGVPVGAFTWALTTVLSRWEVVEFDGNRQMTVTHAKVMDRVGQLLTALSVKNQNPMIAGPRILDEIPVFQRSVNWNSGAVVSEEPDVVDDHRELWGGEGTADFHYTLSWQKGNTSNFVDFATVKVNPSTSTPAKEYWTIDTVETSELLQETSGALIKIKRGSKTLANPKTWNWGQSGSAGAPSEPDANLRIFKTAVSILALGVAEQPDDSFKLTSICWRATQTLIDKHPGSTFDPSLGNSNTIYPQSTAANCGWTGKQTYATQPVPA